MQALSDALEPAAKVCDAISEAHDGDEDVDNHEASNCADAIRKMIGEIK